MTAIMTRAAALADWREQIGILISVAGASVLAIAGVLIAIVRKLLEQHRASRERLTLEKLRLDRAVNNMTQGLLLFDAGQRLVVCNQRYIEMYSLSADVVKPGCSFHDIIVHRKATGSFNGDIDDYVGRVLRDIHMRNSMVIETANGRSIQILNEPLADGGWVATHEDITERRRTEERITHLAHYDALTDLPNRTMFHEHLREKLATIVDGEELAVHYIDIDEFKGVNDALGHLVGDELLKSVAASLSRCAGPADFVARLGGDEFAIVQSAVTSLDQVNDLVARVFDAIRTPFDCMGHHLTADASIGIALAPGHGTALDQILKNADMAMYAAKASGRRTYRFFEPEMDAKVHERRQLEIDLRHAIAKGGREGGLEVYYQPCLSLKDDRITGCEALVRWRHPERGMVSPAEFIPIAEDTGLINEIGEWVLATACRDAAAWPDDIRLAVNVSPVQFKSGTLALKIMSALANSNLPASRLELEITEAVLIRDDDAALAILHQLRAIGVRIALDDFGTGYSSLSYLHRFPFDKIKIDRCFVSDIAGPDGSASIVQAVVNLAAARRMTTTAEGVETEEQQRLLRTLGCSEMQGYLFSAAKPADKMLDLFALHRSRLAQRDGAESRRREAG
jgi:diguanylate cyclase (GGDEF)-like protein